MIAAFVRNNLSKHGISFAMGALVLYGLYLSKLYNYLLFHSLVEFSSVIASFLVFALIWHSRHLLDNRYLLVVGIASLFAGAVDLLHALAFKGMGIFPGNGADLPTQLWIAFRYLVSLSFLTAPLIMKRPCNARDTVISYAVITITLLWSIFSGNFPACFVEGQGLTRFKILSEYVICVIFLASLGYLWLLRESFDSRVFRLMSASLIASVISELCFTQYVSVYGAANMIGHFFLLGSVAFIYRAVVVTGIAEPSSILFRDLKRSEEALKISEGKYRALFDNMADGLAYHKVIFDEAGKPADYIFLEVNHAFQRITGLKRSDIIGRRMRDVMPGIEDDSTDWVATYSRVAIHGEVMRFERHSRPLEKWFSVTAYSPLHGHFATVIEDITDKKQAEKEIEHLASFPRLNPNPVIELDTKGRVSYANQAALSVLELLAPGEGPGVFVPNDLYGLLKTINTASDTQVLSREVNVGEHIFAESIYVSPALEVARIYATDITQRKRAEEFVQQSLHRFALLAWSAGELLQTAEPQKLVESICQKVMEYLDCHAFFNFLADEPAGKLHLNAYAGIPKDEAAGIEWLEYGQAVCGCAARDGCRIVAEHIPSTPDPRTELVKSYGIKAYACHPLLGPAGKVIGTLSFGTRSRETFSSEDLSLMRAVTDQVAIAMTRMKDEAALREKQAALEQKAAELLAVNRELESFSYSVSHDLRAPLRHITGFVNLLQKGSENTLDETNRHYLDVIADSGRQMGKLIDDLLSLSRTSRTELKRREIDVSALVRDTISGLSTEADGRTITWDIKALPLIQADPGLMQLVFMNLIGNAVKFTRTRREAKIDIAAEEQNGEYVFHVKDNGVGFDMKYRNKLFAVFQRLHRPEEFEGTGIGLANVQRIVHRHGGRVWAEGKADEGATFSFSLPKQEAPVW